MICLTYGCTRRVGTEVDRRLWRLLVSASVKKASNQRARARNCRTAVDVLRPWRCDVCLRTLGHARFAHGDRAIPWLAVLISTCPWCQTDLHTRLHAIRHVEQTNASVWHGSSMLSRCVMRTTTRCERPTRATTSGPDSAEKLAKTRLMVRRWFDMPAMTCWCVRCWLWAGHFIDSDSNIIAPFIDPQ